jgi:biopolymer transport protein TolQ
MYYLFAANPFFESYAQSDWFGKIIFISLFTLSILSWIILVNKIWLTRTVKKISMDLRKTFEKHKKTPLNVELSQHKIKEVPNPFYEMYQVIRKYTLEMLSKNRWYLENHSDKKQAFLSTSDIDALDAHLAVTITSEIKKLEKNLFVLPTVVTLAPFMGLLGTVWGILLTFSALQENTVVSSNVMVLSGLSMALATTVLGLVVAIPALIAYSYLKNKIAYFESEMEDFSHAMLSAIELQYRKVDVE